MTMKGSLPPSSSTRLLDLPAGLRRHLRPGGLAAGQGDGLDARIVDDAAHLVGADQQGLKDVRGKAGAADDVFDRQRALRHVGGVLEQAHVARHQGRREKAEDLPERKVPGHDGEHRADRLITDEALGPPVSTGSSASSRSACST